LAVTALISLVVTLPAVLFIPRARQSPAFDRVLWVSTWFLALLGAWYVLGNVNLPGLDGVVIGEVPVIPALIGAAAGALLLNGLLWSMDFFSRPQIEEDAMPREGNVPPDAAAASAGEGESQGVGSSHLGD
jgi:hypothetical protein